MVRATFTVVDVVGRVLDEEGIEGTIRVFYRLFARQLVKLVKEGKVSVRIKVPSAQYYAAISDKIEKQGCICFTHTGCRSYAVCWKICRTPDELIEFYADLYGLEKPTLVKIVEALNKEEKIIPV